MKAMHRTDLPWRQIGLGMAACGILLMLSTHAATGPVVQTTESTTEQGTTTETWPGWSGQSWTTDQEAIKKAPATAPQTTPSPSTQTQQTPQQQVPPMMAPRTMPVPPTYAPGSPGAPWETNAVDPYGAMPMAPTGYGSYETGRTESGGVGPNMVRPGSLGGAAGMTPGQPSTSGLSGYGGGYGAPPSPTPTMSLGGMAMADPSFGRYEAANIREATAASQPASIGRSESEILRGNKPFSGYKPQSATSPYLRLSDDLYRSTGTNTYYNYVKPLIDQQQENRQVTHNLQGLSNTARSDYQTLESLKQRPGNTIQGTAPRMPATFMNTGRYYPGYGR